VRLRVDTAADALYLRLDDSEIAESVEVVPGVVLDYNAANDVVGVGMLHLSARSQTFDASELHFERVEGLSARLGFRQRGKVRPAKRCHGWWDKNVRCSDRHNVE